MSTAVIQVVLALCAIGASSCAGSGAGKSPSTSETTQLRHSECVTDGDCASTYHCSNGKCVIGSGTMSSGGGGYCPPSGRHALGDWCR